MPFEVEWTPGGVPVVSGWGIERPSKLWFYAPFGGYPAGDRTRRLLLVNRESGESITYFLRKTASNHVVGWARLSGLRPWWRPRR